MNDNFKIIMLVSVLLAALAGCQLPPGPGGRARDHMAHIHLLRLPLQ